jgi:hypothetical protein
MSKLASDLIYLETLPRGALIHHLLAVIAAALIAGECS